MPMHGHVKGAALREFVAWLGARDAKLLHAVLERMPAHHRSVFNPDLPALGIISGTLYPAPVVHAFCDAFAAGGDASKTEELIAAGVRVTMEANFASIYKRIFMRLFISPSLYVRHAQRLWNLHFDTGVLSVVQTGPQRLDWRIRDWHDHHPVLCRMVLYSEPAVFGAMGCHDVTTPDATCISDGDEQCSHGIAWSA